MMVRDDNTIFINPLRPYYGTVEGIDSIFWRIDFTERYKMLAKTYQYHSLVDYISCYKTKEWNRNGFGRPSNSILNPATVQYDSLFEYQIDSVKWCYMEKFVREVSSRTQLIMAISPMYSFHTDHGGLTKFKELCTECHVPVLDHFCDTEFVDSPELYVDMAHLNKTGSEIWSRLVASELKTLILK